MSWISIIPSALTLLGDGVKAFFGIKQSQLQNVDKIIETINSSNLSASEREKAIATVIASEANSGYWLAAAWRPLFMVILVGIVVAYSFGYVSPNLLEPMPESSMLRELFELLKIGVMGYMPLRTVDKAVEAFTRAGVLKHLFDKIVKK